MAENPLPPPAIGIDLGVTYSCAAAWWRHSVEIIPNDLGERLTPSYVAFTGTGRLVGDAAKILATTNPTDTVFDVMMLIGRKFSDPLVQSDKKRWPFKVVQSDKKRGLKANDKPMIVVTCKGEEKQFSAEEITSMILTKMKDYAEAFLGVLTVKNAVITVPAYFNTYQRQATKDAGTISGLNVLHIISQPTAAAIAYFFDKKYMNFSRQNVLVFNHGDVNFDVSLLTVENSIFEVKAIAGDSRLGGKAFDSRMTDYFVKEFKRRHRKDIKDSPRALNRLRECCEKARMNLYHRTQTVIGLDCLYDGTDFQHEISRIKFEELNFDLFKECIGYVDKCLKDAKMDKKIIGHVILVGGSTRIPKIQQMLQDFFNGKELCKSIDPDEVVAYGAAVRAANLCGVVKEKFSDSVLCKVGSLSLIGKSISEDANETCVLPLSLGMRADEDETCVLIPRGARVPTKGEAHTTTIQDNQTSVSIEVYAGERPRTSNCILLGTFVLRGIPPAPKGAPDISVCFEIDHNFFLTVSAQDKKSGKKHSMIISDIRHMLPVDEVTGMLDEAEKFKLEDLELKYKIDAKNLLKNYVYSTRATVTNIKLVVEKMEEEIKSAVNWLNENTVTEADVFLNKKNELDSLWSPVISKF